MKIRPKNNRKKEERPRTFIKQEEELRPVIPYPFIVAFFIYWVYLVLTRYYRIYPLTLNRLDWVLSVSRSLPQSINFLATMGNHVLRLVYLLLILLAGFGLGNTIFKKTKLFSYPNLEKFVFSLGLGLGVIILYIFTVGILGILYKPVILIFLLVFAFIGCLKFREVKFRLEKKSFLELFLLFILFLFIFFNFVASLVPETFYDSLVYHLGVPLQWLQNHRIFEIPSIHMSYYPLNIQLLYGIGILLKDEILASMIHFSLGILLVLMIYTFCQKYFNRRVALFASTVFYTVPLVAMVTSKTATELALGVYELLAVFSFVNWASENKREWFYLSAIFSGIALGSKYISGFCVVSLMVAIFLKCLFFDKEKIGTSLKRIIIFGLISFLFASPWYIRNLINTGNPIYPFLSDKIGFLQPRAWALSDPGPYSLSLKSILLLPWKSTMGQVQESFPGPIFLLLLPLFLIYRKVSKPVKLLWLYFLPYFLLWVVVGKVYLRYFIPTLTILSIISAYYLFGIKENLLLRRGLILACCIIFITNLEFSLSMQKVNRDPWGVALGFQTKEDYLGTQRPSYPCPYYGTINWANRNLPKDAKILFIGECRGYYSKRKIICATAADFAPVIEYIKESENAEDLYLTFNREGITHFLVNLKEAIRLKGYNIFHWDKKEFEIFCNFWDKYIKELYGEYGVYLYEILSIEEAEEPHQAPINFIRELETYDFEENTLLKIYWEHKQWDELEREYKSILQSVTTKDAYVYFFERLAEVYVQKRKYSEAMSIFERILKINPARQDLKQKLDLLNRLSEKEKINE
jgi:tetratricopeptide (TPR) repeat protein